MAAGLTPTWDASAAIANCPVQPWTGLVWRYHARKYAGNEAAGSLTSTGRFNRGSDKFPEQETWAALYTSLAPHVALGERLRHATASTLGNLANQRQSRLRVELQAVLNLCGAGGCAELNVLGLDEANVCHPTDYDKPQHIAHIARGKAEALLVPSCTKYPEGNLIVFPDRLRPGSVLLVAETLDPDLYIDWENLP